MKLRLQVELREERHGPLFEALLFSRGQLTRMEAAKICGMDEARFSADFTKTYDASFRQVRASIRIAIARCLLEHSGLRISEVAAFVGYSTAREFRYRFKRSCKLAPSEFRSSAGPQCPDVRDIKCLMTIDNGSFKTLFVETQDRR
jgi:AraC-like DNA-binding protein